MKNKSQPEIKKPTSTAECCEVFERVVMQLREVRAFLKTQKHLADTAKQTMKKPLDVEDVCL